jgi:hypothetical protein
MMPERRLKRDYLKDYLTCAGVAKRLDVSVGQVQQLTEERRLVPVDTPVGELYPVSVVDAYSAGWIAANERPPLEWV